MKRYPRPVQSLATASESTDGAGEDASKPEDEPGEEPSREPFPASPSDPPILDEIPQIPGAGSEAFVGLLNDSLGATGRMAEPPREEPDPGAGPPLSEAGGPRSDEDPPEPEPSPAFKVRGNGHGDEEDLERVAALIQR